MKRYWKQNKQSTKEETLTQEEEGRLRHRIQTTIRKVLTYIVLIFCATSFYLHKFIEPYGEDILLAEKKYEEAKRRNTIALNKVKKLALGTQEYENYKIANSDKKEAHSLFVKKIENNKFLVFSSFQHFLERFGLISCVFFYAIYNLIKSFMRERFNVGAKLVHTFMLSVCFNYFFWIFQSFQDLTKASYVFVTILSATLMFLAIHFITKYKQDRIYKLRMQMYDIAKVALRNSRPEKLDETFKILKEIANDK